MLTGLVPSKMKTLSWVGEYNWRSISKEVGLVKGSGRVESNAGQLCLFTFVVLTLRLKPHIRFIVAVEVVPFIELTFEYASHKDKMCYHFNLGNCVFSISSII